MTFADSIKTCFRKFATFSGRASRSEYWYFVLFVVLAAIVLGMIDAAIFGAGTETEPGGSLLVPIWQLVTLLPLTAAAWRRMHDTGRSGMLLLLPLAISFLIMFMMTFGIMGATLAGVDPTDPAGMTMAFGGMGLMMGAMLLQIAIAILLLVWLVRPSQPETNAYGPPPAEART